MCQVDRWQGYLTMVLKHTLSASAEHDKSQLYAYEYVDASVVRTISQNQKVDSHQKRWQERPAAHAVDDAKAVRVDAAEVRAGAIDRHVAQENVLDLSDRRHVRSSSRRFPLASLLFSFLT